MKLLKSEEVYGARYYRFNVESTFNYLGGDAGNIAAAPLIHTYSARFETVSTRLALQKDQEFISIGATEYKVRRFLTVQAVNSAFFKDEGGEFIPTVKPHYAIAPKNGGGLKYNQLCRTLLSIDDEIVYNAQLSVHAHDMLVSPCIGIPGLAKRLKQAFTDQKDTFITSYVVDPKNKQIIITEHCLLTDEHHDRFFAAVNLIPNPTVEALASMEGPMKAALQHFDVTDTASDLLRIKMVLSGDTTKPNHNVVLLKPHDRLALLQKKFNLSIDELKKKTQELIEKGTEKDKKFNKRYIQVAIAAKTLEDALTAARHHPCFTEPRPEALADLRKKCETAIDAAVSEFKKHRNIWYQAPPFLRGILALLAILTILPARATS